MKKNQTPGGECLPPDPGPRHNQTMKPRMILSMPAIALGIEIGAGLGFFPSALAGSPLAPEAVAVKALGDLSDLPPAMRGAYEPSPDFFELIHPPTPGDWLAHQKEPGQPFLAYAGQLSRQPRQQPGRQRIYILPLGEFGPAAPSLETLRHYTEAFFGKTARILNPVTIDDVPAARRGSALTGNLKLLTTDILNWLPGQKPEDARAILAVTMADLYAGEGWNFVFGQAQIDTGAGVFSFARYGQEPSDTSKELILRRSCKVLSHEVGHMFGLYHCIYYECVMNGSNHLRETDSRPMHLCPVCLRKLQMGAGFDVQSREISLNAFYQAHRLKPEADWTRRRIEKMKQAAK